MLRHLGLTRRQIGSMLAAEGALAAGVGVFGGLLAGGAIGLVLIEVVNRQIFPLEHGPARAVGVRCCCSPPALIGARRAGGGARRPPGDAPGRGARGARGLVMRAAAPSCSHWRACRLWAAAQRTTRSIRRLRAGAARPTAGLSARLRRAPGVPHRVVVRHRLAETAGRLRRSASRSPSSASAPASATTTRAPSHRAS